MDQSPLARAMAAVSNVYQTGKEKALNAMQAAGERGVAGNTIDALKGSAASLLTGTLGAPADYLSMVPLAPKESGNPYANAIRDFVQDPDKPFLGSDYLAEKIGLGGEGLAYGAGQMIGPSALKNLLQNTVKSDIFVRPKEYWKDWAETEKQIGKTPEEIYQGGGKHGPSRMFKGADEQWYQEIPDYNARLTPEAMDFLGPERNMYHDKEIKIRNSLIHQKMDELYPGRWPTRQDLFDYFYDESGKVKGHIKKDAQGNRTKEYSDYRNSRNSTDAERRVIKGTLRDVLEHPELEKAAPELFDLPISFDRFGNASPSYKGSFNPKTGLIEAGSRSHFKTGGEPELGTLLHETQHGAQQLFDYGGGGSPSTVFRPERNFIDPPSEEMVRDYAEQLKRPDVEPFRPIDRMAWDPKNPTQNEEYYAYRNIHGEQMARMASDRHKIPPNKLKVPEYDTHPSNLIYSLPPSLQKLLESLKGVP
jgi:hypothetical protein